MDPSWVSKTPATRRLFGKCFSSSRPWTQSSWPGSINIFTLTSWLLLASCGANFSWHVKVGETRIFLFTEVRNKTNNGRRTSLFLKQGGDLNSSFVNQWRTWRVLLKRQGIREDSVIWLAITTSRSPNLCKFGDVLQKRLLPRSRTNT